MNAVVLTRIIFWFSCSALLACGFHLRGDSQLSPELNPLYLQPGQLTTTQIAMIRKGLTQASAQLLESNAAANRLQVSLTTLKPRKITASNSAGFERYLLSVELHFSIVGPDATELRKVVQLNQTREVELDSSNVLSHQQSIDDAIHEMEQSLVRNMIFRLSH